MPEAQLQQFLEKVRQLNAFVALSEADRELRQELRECEHHDQVVALARRCGFEIGRRWGESATAASDAEEGSDTDTVKPVDGRSAVTTASMASQRSAPADACRECPPTAGSRPLVAPGDGIVRSLLLGPCPPAGEEVSEVLIETPLWRLERIHSCSSCSPDGFWYEQQEDEWVLLLQGSARLRFEDQSADQTLQPGESLWIRAGRRHRVTATDQAPGTIWLVLFWRMA
jgi:cupin 2 domain-containing protein